MKSTIFLFAVLLLAVAGFSQDTASSAQPNVIAKWAPTGLLLGSLSLQAEYNFGGKNSLTAKIGLPVSARRTFTFEDEQATFNMKATSFLAGYRTYLSRKHLQGLYFEPFFKYVYHTSEGVGTGSLGSRPATFDLMNTYSAFGFGVQLGAQFFISKRFVIDVFFLGPEINSASNSFKAAEVNRSGPWTNLEGAKVEGDIRDFLNQFPIIRNKVKLMVDTENKRVTSNFKGALPGLRTGVSIGFAF